MNEKLWYLKHCQLFARLSPERIARLEACCLSREFARGELVYLPSDQGESVMLMARGRVRLYHVTSDGKQAILGFIEPGELFGELAFFGGTRREEYAEAAETSLIVMIPRHEMLALTDEHPEVSLRLTKLFGFRLRRVERRLKSLLFRSSRDRLIHLLLELSEKYGRDIPGGVLIGLRISHADLASIIGATRETVTITLGELQQEGYLTIQRRQVVLRNVPRLAEIVDFGPVTVANAAL